MFNDRDLVLDPGMRSRLVRRSHLFNKWRGGIHLKGLKKSLANKFVPGFATDFFYHLTGRHVENVLINETRTQRVAWLDIPHPFQHVVGRNIHGCPEEVRISYAGIVREEVAYTYFARGHRIVKLKVREVVDHLVIPLYLSLIYKHSHARCRHRFRGRRTHK